MLIIVFNFVVYQNSYSQGTSNAVLQGTNKVVSYLQNKYLNLQIVQIYKRNIISPNINQNSLNDHYNSYYKLTNNKPKAEGTCAEVATALLTKAHKVNQGSYEYIFRTVMNTAVDNKYWTAKYGTYSGNIDALVTKSFKFWNSTKTGNNDHFNIYTTFVNNINSGKTSVFSCLDQQHAWRVGYAEYDIKYSQKILCSYITISKTERFIIVNDGWTGVEDGSDYVQYSYYPASSISSIFTLTKVV
ncbi:MAG: hypothetical protein LBF12_04415 [Christensenellaceae bacterium]|jgi:hypothetical protein|nr:hypothetical protein [Christensenellaceae bacterium]